MYLNVRNFIAKDLFQLHVIKLLSQYVEQNINVLYP